jgi:hypothetical protein
MSSKKGMHSLALSGRKPRDPPLFLFSCSWLMSCWAAAVQQFHAADGLSPGTHRV